MRCQVGRGGGHQAAGFGHAADGDVGVRLELAGAYGHVNVVVNDVHVAVGRFDMHLHIRVALGVFAQQRRHMVHGKRQRGRDAQGAARVQGGGVHCRLGVFQVGQDGAGAAEKLAARVGQVQPARVALDQTRAQALLQG